MGEGLDRHDALHAVASVVMDIVFDVVREKGKGGARANAGGVAPRQGAGPLRGDANGLRHPA
jgi:hypothetical protein